MKNTTEGNDLAKGLQGSSICGNVRARTIHRETGSPDLVRIYCKRPGRCARCRAWLGGRNLDVLERRFADLDAVYITRGTGSKARLSQLCRRRGGERYWVERPGGAVTFVSTVPLDRSSRMAPNVALDLLRRILPRSRARAGFSAGWRPNPERDPDLYQTPTHYVVGASEDLAVHRDAWEAAAKVAEAVWGDAPTYGCRPPWRVPIPAWASLLAAEYDRLSEPDPAAP